MPAISALSGNLGLQASANTIRGIGTGDIWLENLTQIQIISHSGQINSSSYLSNMWKEIKSGLLSATIVATIICAIGTLWAYSDGDNAEINKTWIMKMIQVKPWPCLFQRSRASIRVWECVVHGNLDINDDSLCQWIWCSNLGDQIIEIIWNQQDVCFRQDCWT